MPKLDECHPQIVRALQKAGWDVDDVPRRLRYEERVIYIDLRATQRTNGTVRQILLAEIKCFPNRDDTTRELYIAVGQYIIYRTILAELRDTSPLYLVVPEAVYNQVFDSTAWRAMSDNKIKMLIVNVETETIVQWIE